MGQIGGNIYKGTNFIKGTAQGISQTISKTFEGFATQGTIKDKVASGFSNLYMGTVHGLYTGDTEMFDGFIHNVAFFTNTNISDANIASIYALGKDGDVRDVLTPQHYYNHSISNWASGSGGITDIVGDKSGTLVGTAQTLTAYKVNDLTNNGNDGDLK